MQPFFFFGPPVRQGFHHRTDRCSLDAIPSKPMQVNPAMTNLFYTTSLTSTSTSPKPIIALNNLT